MKESLEVRDELGHPNINQFFLLDGRTLSFSLY